MIVSLQVTHSSAGSDMIADVIPKMEKGADEFVRSLSSVSEYVIIRTCNRFEIYVTISFYVIGNAFADAADPKNHQ